jgi:hypothetical protein
MPVTKLSAIRLSAELQVEREPKAESRQLNVEKLRAAS